MCFHNTNLWAADGSQSMLGNVGKQDEHLLTAPSKITFFCESFQPKKEIIRQRPGTETMIQMI